MGESLMIQNLSFASYACTDVGLQRPHNEDAYISRPDIGLWIVADGMGGHEKGDEASKLACATIAEKVSMGLPVLSAINLAHQNIARTARINKLKAGMGTTVVVLQIIGLRAHIWWVGDTRAYALSGNNLQCLTRDHSVVQELVDMGAINEIEALSHPKRNVITQSLGLISRETLNVSSVEFDCDPTIEFLLCTDGLHNELRVDEIQHIMKQNDKQEDRAEALVAGAKSAGGRDNITAMLINLSAAA